MVGLNRIQLLGQVGGEPDLKYTLSGELRCQLRLGVETFHADEPAAKIEWFRVEARGTWAELVRDRVTKNQSVYLEGALETKSAEGIDGQVRYYTQVQVTFLTLLPRQEIAIDERRA